MRPERTSHIPTDPTAVDGARSKAPPCSLLRGFPPFPRRSPHGAFFLWALRVNPAAPAKLADAGLPFLTRFARLNHARKRAWPDRHQWRHPRNGGRPVKDASNVRAPLD